MSERSDHTELTWSTSEEAKEERDRLIKMATILREEEEEKQRKFDDERRIRDEFK